MNQFFATAWSFLTASSLTGPQLWELFFQFATLSLVSVSGAIAMSSDMHRFLVDEKHWLTSVQFTDSLTLAQVAPGPNILFVFLLGYKTAGLPGAIATFAGIMIPASTITFFANRWRAENLETRFVRAMRLGLSPIAIGLTAAAGVVLSQASGANWKLLLVSVITLLVLLRTKINPMWLIGAGALLGMTGWM
jgi:chromate transporter